MICNKCGKTIVDDAVFCSYCGAKQELSCEECGTKLPLDARFCHRCGAPTEKQIKNGIDWDALHAEAMKVFEDDVNREELREAARRRDAAEWEEFAAEQRKKEAEIEREIAQIFGKKEIPNVPTEEKVKNKEFYISTSGSGVKEWNRTLEVQVRWENDYADDTDPMHFLFSKTTFYDEKYDEENRIKELTNISAYVLAENGVYFAEPVTQQVKFWNAETGEMVVIGTNMKDVLFMDYDGGFVYVETFEKLSQIAWSEHRDECGYMWEAWYDIYNIHTKKHTFLAVK